MSNYCAAKVETKEWDDVISMGQRILEAEKNGKAMYRLAQAYFATEDYEQAEEYIIGACSIFPQDQKLQLLKTEIQDKIKANTNSQKTEEVQPVPEEKEEPIPLQPQEEKVEP